MNDKLERRTLTLARIQLRRAGSSLATSEALDAAASLAEARDAVHAPLSTAVLLPKLKALGLDVLQARSAASNRSEYLRHPARGRQLHEASRERLAAYQAKNRSAPEIVFVVADGLSAMAAERHSTALLAELLRRLPPHGRNAIGPIVVAEQARVALGDDIGACLHADLVVMLIGERPGMSSPDSLGAYLTWSPQPGRTDAERNCISNIRPDGLAYDVAAGKLAAYILAIRQARLSGTSIKEPAGILGPPENLQPAPHE